MQEVVKQLEALAGQAATAMAKLDIERERERATSLEAEMAAPLYTERRPQHRHPDEEIPSELLRPGAGDVHDVATDHLDQDRDNQGEQQHDDGGSFNEHQDPVNGRCDPDRLGCPLTPRSVAA